MQPTKQATNNKLLNIVIKASNLQERIDRYYTNSLPDNDDLKVDLSTSLKRINRWKQVVASGDESKFQHRIAWMGLEKD
ncbi:MAG: hypothetical protein ACFCAD_13515 [Pleurocapsa sp.]